MFKKTFSLFALAALTCLPAFSVQWLTDYEAAKAQAKAEKKLILMDFTGSDWCSSCIAMRKDVLDTPQFEEYAKDKFVCLEVDMPHHGRQPEKLREQNAKLCEAMEIRVYPTIAVTAPDGQVVGGFLGGIEEVSKAELLLNRAVKAGKSYRKAAKQKGEDRAKSLFKVWTNIPAELRGNSQAMKEEIIRLDTKHTTGMDDELKAEEQLKAFNEDLRPVTGAEDFLAVTLRYAPIAMPQNKVEIYRWMTTMLHQTAQTEEDIAKVAPYALELAELDISITEKQKKALIDDYSNPKKYLKRILKEREEMKE